MTTEIQMNAVFGGVLKDFWGMRQENFEGIRRYIYKRSGKIITAVIMRIIDADKP